MAVPAWPGVAAVESFRQPVPPQPAPADSSTDADAVRDAAADPASRLAAARRLLAAANQEARPLVQALLLGSPDSAAAPTAADLTARSIMLQAISQTPNAPPWLFGLITSAPASPDSVEFNAEAARAEEIAAAASIRTRETVRWLIEQGRADPAQTSNAVAALKRLTGKTEFDRDLDRWSLWLGQVQWISEAEWRRELAEGLAARSDQLAAQRDRAAARLVAELRRSFIATQSSADRSELLAGFLNDPLPDVRSLGLDLATQELANARRLESSVGAAAVRLLSDPSADVRRDAAQLVSILAPEEESAQVLEALRRETDPTAAALLLRTAARWPDPSLTPVALPWLEAGHATVAPACELLDAIRTRWPQAVSQAAPRILEVLHGLDAPGVTRPTPPGADPGDQPLTLSPAALRLLYSFGPADERERINALLRSATPDTRLAVASALAPLDEAVTPLLAAAQSDPSLFPAAAQAVIASRATAAGYRELAAIPGVDPSLRREQLLLLSESLSHIDLYQVAFATSDRSDREAMLIRLLTEPVASQRLAQDNRVAKPGVVAGLLLLYRTRVELGRPAGALAALDALSPVLDSMDRQDQEDRRTMLLLWLNRVDEAARFGGSLDSWVQGLERCIDLPHARQVLTAIDRRFGTDLTGPESERLAALRRVLDSRSKK